MERLSLQSQMLDSDLRADEQHHREAMNQVYYAYCSSGSTNRTRTAPVLRWYGAGGFLSHRGVGATWSRGDFVCEWRLNHSCARTSAVQSRLTARSELFHPPRPSPTYARSDISAGARV